VRLRLIRLGYRVAWRLLWLTAPLHRGRGRGVKALLSSDGKVLLVLHTYGPPQWELPGGGVHRHETPRDGIRRELREELALEAPDLTLIATGCGSGRQPKRIISVFTAEVDAAAVEPDHREIDRAEWHDPDALPHALGWQVEAAVAAWRDRPATASAPVELPV
jgi:ADP-ribose pyrophosphatase YjhB (NUDIX family)